MSDVQEAVDKQDESWAKGTFVRVEDLILQDPRLQSEPDVIMDLLWNEKRLRERFGPEARSEYLRQELRNRFPRLTAQIDRQFDCEQLIRGMPTAVIGVPPLDAENSLEERPGLYPKLPDYTITGECGRGATGVVYSAMQESLGRKVAIKMMNHKEVSSIYESGWIYNEAVNIAKISHPFIIQIYDIKMYDGIPFFSMEFMGRKGLNENIGTFSGDYRGIARFISQVASAIDHAHSKGILHRDVQPRNILIADDGTPRVADFGFATLVTKEGRESADEQEGEIEASLGLNLGVLRGGTPGFMAPEQGSNSHDRADRGTDVYGVGAVLYWMMTGKPPNSSKIAWVAPRPPREVAPEIPKDLAAVAMKCLAEKPADRYTTAAEVADDLERFLQGFPVQAHPLIGVGGLTERGVKLARREPVKAILAIILASVLVSSCVGYVLYNRRLGLSLEETKQQRDMLAVATLDLADFIASRGVKSSAVPVYERALALSNDLANRNPMSATFQARLANTTIKLGQLLGHLGDSKRAESLLRSGIAMLTALALQTGGKDAVESDLATAHGALGTLFYSTGRREEAARELAALEASRRSLYAKEASDIRLFELTASILDQVHLIQEFSGRTEEAIQRIRQAIRTLETLVAKNKNSDNIQLKLQQAYDDLAGLYISHGKPRDAESIYLQAVDQWETLLQSDPNVTAYRRFLAASLSDLGNMRITEGRLEEGKSDVERALQVHRRILDDHADTPAIRGEYGAGMLNLAYYHQSTGRRDLALRTAVESQSLVSDSLRDDSENVITRISFIKCECLIGELNAELGRFEDADKHYKMALAAQANIVPPTLESNLNALVMYNNIGRMLKDYGKYDEARGKICEGVILGERLVADNPAHVEIIAALSYLYDAAGLLSMREEDSKVAIEWFTKSIGKGELALKLGHANANDLRVLRETYARRGVLRSKSGEHAAALGDLDKSLEHGVQKNSRTELLRVERAAILARMGRHADAIISIRKIEVNNVNQYDILYNCACVCSIAFRAARDDPKLSALEIESATADYFREAMRFLEYAKRRGDLKRKDVWAGLHEDPEFAAIRNAPEFRRFQESLPPPSD